MLEVSYIRENKEEVIKRLKKRSIQDLESKIDQILEIDNLRKKNQTEYDNLLTESNKMAKEIGALILKGKQSEVDSLKQYTSETKARSAIVKEKMNENENTLKELLYLIPNMPNELVPIGKTPEENETVFQNIIEIKLPKEALSHWDLAKKYDLIDFELGVKIAGAGFPVYKNKGARLQRGLINFFLDQAIEAGYIEIMPPLMVNQSSAIGTGQLPDKQGQMYHDATDDLYLIPTAEVPVTNIYRDVIVKEEELPIKLTAYTPCFRREAGSYGKDVRGLNRLHQFDKVEIVQFSKPENSYENLDRMVDHVKGLLDQLELPYRTLRLCGGDMGFASALTYDMEVYSAAQEKWLEVSSISNFETFQANRLKCRYKNKEGKIQLMHTLNGSALALPRIVAALLENNQTEIGIKIPTALHAYVGFESIN
jgi:seryl-tRNA synthetase